MKRVILLTATVRPSIVTKDTGSCEERFKEYLEAIDFYMKHTIYPIVIVDNSNYGFSRIIHDSSRFESLSYDGIDIGRGKGWGECDILKYALKHSVLLKDVDQIVKITGRLIVNNINRILSNCRDSNAVYADADLKLTYVHSYFFCCSRSFLERELFPRHDQMYDKEGVHFEHVLGFSIRSSIGEYAFHEINYPIHLIGHAGSSREYYKKPSLIRYILIIIKYIINEASCPIVFFSIIFSVFP